MDYEILKLIIGASTPVAITLILWKSGLLNALASRLKRNSYDQSLVDLQEWRELVEENHFNDLEELKEEVKILRDKLNDIDKRLTVVEVRLFNNRH